MCHVGGRVCANCVHAPPTGWTMRLVAVGAIRKAARRAAMVQGLCAQEPPCVAIC